MTLQCIHNSVYIQKSNIYVPINSPNLNSKQRSLAFVTLKQNKKFSEIDPILPSYKLTFSQAYAQPSIKARSFVAKSPVSGLFVHTIP